MSKMTDIYKEYVDTVKGDMQGAETSARDMLEYILASTARYHGRCVRSLQIPKLITADEVWLFDELVGTLYGIFGKVMNEYRANEDYRRLFGFDKRLEKLILKEPSYSSDIPIARIDIFLDEKTHEFKFCEFNTDGTSAMNEDRELCRAAARTKAFKKFEQTHTMRSFELFDTWVSAVKGIYADYCAHNNTAVPVKPRVCIADFMESATENEFVVFRDAFERAGFDACICEIRRLKLNAGGRLCTPDGRETDIVYRRAVTSDIMAHYDEVSDFIAAARNNSVCLVGDFRTQIVHNKMIYKVLHDDATTQLLNDEERRFVAEHVPYTVILSSARLNSIYRGRRLLDSVLDDREKWIIKPEDSYGSKGVHAGVECTRDEWEHFVDLAAGSSNVTGGKYILQEFVKPYKTENIDLSGSGKWRMYSNLTGLYVYDGKFAGVYSRVSECEMISTQYSEMSIPTFLVES